MKPWSLFVLALSLCLGPVALADAAPVAMRAALDSSDLATQALTLPVGSELTLERVALGASLETLELTRFEVFTDDFRFEVDGEPAVQPARSARYRGTLVGDPTSRVLVTFRPDGSHRGLVFGADGAWVLEGGGAVAGLPGVQAAPTAGRVEAMLEGGEREGFTCLLDQTDPGRDALDPLLDGLSIGDAPEPTLEAMLNYDYTARVAVETDWEFFSKFGNVADAVAYVADLFAYASITYEREIATSLLVSSLSLWSQPNDPWSQTQSNCALYEFGGYWNNNNGDNARTIAHFLSGKSTNSGVAWLGVLCNGAFNTNTAGCSGLPAGPHGGAYGFTGGIDGQFTIASPQIMWESVAVMHEIGHNFNSDHTHCYNGVGGNSEPVDECYAGEGIYGCYAGTQRLPGPVGARSGTLMSYCHLQGGGFSNIAMTFGETHQYGVAPQRVPARMRSHVESRANLIPACLAPVTPPPTDPLIFGDGFEGGTLSAWSGAVP